MTRKEYDHERYMANREARIEAQLIYNRKYLNKGLRKPRKPRDPSRRKARDHERYLEKRDEILAKQKIYRETHTLRESTASHTTKQRNYERRESKHTTRTAAGTAERRGCKA